MFRFMEHSPRERTAGAVRAELARRKVTASALAKALGWSAGKTSRRLNAEAAFDVEELSAVADFLGIPASTFLAEPERAA